jgi:hypothetical protein
MVLILDLTTAGPLFKNESCISSINDEPDDLFIFSRLTTSIGY